MKDNKYTPLMRCHMILLCVMGLLSLVAVVLFAADVMPAAFRIFFEEHHGLVNIYAIMLVLNAVALEIGFIYLLNGYSKNAAIYYKTFLLMIAIVNVFDAIGCIVAQGFGLALIIKIIKIILLVGLVFWKDQGKRYSWMMFIILLVIDLTSSLFFDPVAGAVLYRVLLSLCRLLNTATVGLAILGKYKDKVSRGTD